MYGPDLGIILLPSTPVYQGASASFFATIVALGTRMITERDIAVLLAVVRYYVLNRVQIQRLCFPADPSGRIARRRIQALVDFKYINRTQMQVVNPSAGSPAPLYYPAQKGCEFLAEYCNDERFLATPTQTPQNHHLFHWLAVSEAHIVLDQAIAAEQEAHVVDWLSEWDVANHDEPTPEKRYRIYTLIHESPRLVCAPDAAFLLAMSGHQKVFYLEQDRNTSGVHQVAASKSPGYATMAERHLHRKHFPTTTLDKFSVLMIAPSERRRDALKKAMREKVGAGLWRFASVTDLTRESFLRAPIWHLCDGEPSPLIKPTATEGTPG